ncbi:AmmeMemoRadiSam system protein B [Thermodesulfobacteriota bacterium]
MNIRNAVFAGSWYPKRATQCEKEIENFLKEPDMKPASTKNLIGAIVPHAGWYFSGSIACNVIRSLKDDQAVDAIAVFGMHLHSNAPCHLMTEGAWETPFGAIEIEENLAGELAQRFKFKIETPPHCTEDNTIELQLPFIKYFFENVKIVPIGLPPHKKSLEIGRAVAEISLRLGLRIKIVGSTDLTHYGFNYGFAPKGSGPDAVDWVRNENDRRVIDAMTAMESETVIAEGLKSQNACCAGAAAAAIEASRSLGADYAETLAYATSYDKSPGDSLVGYVGIVLGNKN